MSQEEKAKAYDEALKKLHEIITMDNHPVLPKEIGEFLFPELTESEDERIRKELLEEIEFIIPHEDETDSEGLMLPSYRTRISKYRSYLERQKEQKPNNPCDGCNNYKGCINCVDGDQWAHIVECKPAEWSEDDEKLLNIIISDIRRTQRSCGIGTDEWNIRLKAIKWLDSLRPQPH